MKLTKENVYIDLQGKSKEELTELYWVLKNNNEELYRDSLYYFLKYPNDYKSLIFNNNINWCGSDSLGIKKNQKVTIEQLKEILKPMGTFKPIAMKCTQEQFDAVKPKLKGLKIENISPFLKFNYLINNLGEESKTISNVMYSSIFNYNREIHEEWNEETFLKACGIEVETPQPMEKEFDLSMCRIIVDNAEQSKKIQELAFKQGYTWGSKGKEIFHTDMNVLYFDSEYYRITFSSLDWDDSNFNTFHFTDVFKEKELLNNKTMIDLMGYSVLVDNEEQARKLQEIAFEQGFKWATTEGIGLFLSEKSFQFGYNGKKVITYDYGRNHYQDDKFITKKAHFNDLFKEETLQEKEQRLLKELGEVRKEIADSKIKAGDWVWNALNESYYKKTSGLYGIGERKITNPELIKLLEQEKL